MLQKYYEADVWTDTLVKHLYDIIVLFIGSKFGKLIMEYGMLS